MSNQQRREVIQFRKSKLAEKDNQAYLNARKVVSSAVSETVSSSPHPAVDERSDAANQFGRKAYRK